MNPSGLSHAIQDRWPIVCLPPNNIPQARRADTTPTKKLPLQSSPQPASLQAQATLSVSDPTGAKPAPAANAIANNPANQNFLKAFIVFSS
jgi:hypothetical protein